MDFLSKPKNFQPPLPHSQVAVDSAIHFPGGRSGADPGRAERWRWAVCGRGEWASAVLSLRFRSSLHTQYFPPPSSPSSTSNLRVFLRPASPLPVASPSLQPRALPQPLSCPTMKTASPRVSRAHSLALIDVIWISLRCFEVFYMACLYGRIWKLRKKQKFCEELKGIAERDEISRTWGQFGAMVLFYTVLSPLFDEFMHLHPNT